jgi:membrane protein DedA with SNARE-associated domain
MGDIIIHYLQVYQLPAIFAGSFFFGETVVISSAFLAGQNLWSVWNVFWICFLGTIISDTLWFVLGKNFNAKIESHEKHGSRYRKVIAKVNKYVGGRIFLALLFIKFLYGTRILTIFYISARKVSFWKFTLFNSLGTIIWLVVIIGAGYLAGKGTANYLGSLSQVKYVALALVAFILLFRVIDKWTEKKVFDE